MAVLTHTYTKTFNMLNAWASTLPWDCLACETSCCSLTHDHDPMVNDSCAIEDCRELLKIGEECYAVIELPKDERNRNQWVCWRHVRPDEGPVLA